MSRMSSMLMISFAMLIGVSGCVSVETKVVADASTAEFSEFKGEGNSTVAGQAFLRQRGGGVVTCAGAPVYLIPNVGYAKESFGLARSGVRPEFASMPDQPASKALAYDIRLEGIRREVLCDANGDFVFTNVPTGAWILFTTVQWEVADVGQGSVVGKVINVDTNNTDRILLTDANRI